jgi:glutathione S-transferase
MERAVKLYVIASSHPCATAEAALRLKGVGYRVVELPAELHRLHQRFRFGRPTVPSMVLDGEKVTGSRAIVHRVEELAPDPPLLPADPVRRADVEEAERWGDDVLQDVARRIEVLSLSRRPEALPSYMEDSRLPSLPPLVRLLGPLVMRHAARFHGVNEQTVRADLAALPAHLDHVDELIVPEPSGELPVRCSTCDVAAELSRPAVCWPSLTPERNRRAQPSLRRDSFAASATPRSM